MFLEDPEVRLATELYALLGKSQRETLFTAKRLNIPFSALTRGQQEALRKLFGARVAQEEAFAFLPMIAATLRRLARAAAVSS